MASGKKNYFRHSFFARNDIKLRFLKDEVGVGFYFYYFTLLELCGEFSAENLQSQYVFHNSIIRQLWGVNLKKCRTISEKMNAVGLLEFKKGESTFTFVIPNYSKYLGRYSTKLDSNTSNKRKEKKRKEKKSKVIEKDEVKTSEMDNISEIIRHLNSSTGKNYSPKTRGSVSKLNTLLKAYKIDQIKKVITFKCTEWLGGDFEKFLRPETLFGNKFEGYLQDAENQDSRFERASKLFIDDSEVKAPNWLQSEVQ